MPLGYARTSCAGASFSFHGRQRFSLRAPALPAWLAAPLLGNVHQLGYWVSIRGARSAMGIPYGRATMSRIPMAPTSPTASTATALSCGRAGAGAPACRWMREMVSLL